MIVITPAGERLQTAGDSRKFMRGWEPSIPSIYGTEK